MKLSRLVLATSLLALAACQPQNGSSGNTSSSAASSAAASVTIGAEGGFCGGIAGFPCNDGLTCVLDGTYPDAGGTCVKS